ncbi:hypothetical protein SCOR_14090 [Sulfidibacter corallicola]|uniref:Uncharacterized protein n=1 Tax=Sulfidibacter corallicola TaxID=2818388 RepID=A0A8A4TFM5_SULCO|nr:hypothetical protein [Sulfidibacter corallicola]QTD47551.1 hypothetical protein J3U87_18320 [Sulfidibacter corallicola]
MRKLLCLFVVLCASFAMAQPSLELRAKTGTPGFVDADTIDASLITAGEAFCLQIMLNNLNNEFALGGAEYQITAPTFLMLANKNAVGTANAPYRIDSGATGWNTENFQKLPANENGEDTSTTLRSLAGSYRYGIVVTAASDRPTSGSIVLGEACFVRGQDYSASLNSDSNAGARDEPACISSTEVIRLIAADSGSSRHIIAKGDATAALQGEITWTAADLEVNFVNTSTTVVKADSTLDGNVTPADILPSARCIFFGQASASCTLGGISADEFLTRLDCNCDGNVSSGDLLPCGSRAAGSLPRLSKNLNFEALNEGTGSLKIDAMDGAGAVYSGVVFLNGKGELFEDIKLSDAAVADGWNAIAKYHANEQALRYVLFNSNFEDAVFPALNIAYKTDGAASWALGDVQNFNARNEALTVAGNRDHLGVKNQ